MINEFLGKYYHIAEMKRTLKVLRNSCNDKRRFHVDLSMSLLARLGTISIAAIAALAFCNISYALSTSINVVKFNDTHPRLEASTPSQGLGNIISSTLVPRSKFILPNFSFPSNSFALFASHSRGNSNPKERALTFSNIGVRPADIESAGSFESEERKEGEPFHNENGSGRSTPSLSKHQKLNSSSATPLQLLLTRTSRFDIPWNRVPDTHLLSLAESGHRVLLSSISSYGNSGLGHMMAILNSEVHTAMILGLTYTHRRGVYGVLSLQHLTATSVVDDFFGWGRDEIPRDDVYQTFCEFANERNILKVGDKVRPPIHQRPCAICQRIRRPGSLRNPILKGMDVRKIVQVPPAVSLSYCKSDKDPELKSFSCRASRNFQAEHNGTQHALFHLGVQRCDKLPANSDFSQTQGWFYWRYWKAEVVRLRKNLQHRDVRNPSVGFDDGELSIAIHARRGDFFQEANVKRGRVLVSISIYAAIVQTIIRIVKNEGGRFAALPVRVFIYSEGRRGKHIPNSDAHDVSTMTSEFVDSDGVSLRSVFTTTILQVPFTW